MREPGSKLVLDVARLPGTAFDSRAPVWWGNLLLIAIESTTLAVLLSCYFFLQRNFEQWPPPKLDRVPPLLVALPRLTAGTIQVVLLVFSCLPMLWIDRAARERRTVFVRNFLIGFTLLGLVLIGLRVQEFFDLQVRWDDNAYGSIVWAIVFMHFSYLIMETLEVALMAVWVALHGCDSKHAVDVTLTASTWYWVAATGAVVYAVIYWVPRLSAGASA